MEIDNFASALREYERLFPTSPFLKTWIPSDSVISAESDEEGNLLIIRSDKEHYSFAFGLSPKIPSEWINFSIESRAVAALPKEFSAIDKWDCYWAHTLPQNQLSSRESSDATIKEFLALHAPDSSVLPGNEEILHWVEVVNDGELRAVAALCRWQSGEIVISSVATHSRHRGEGLGKQVVTAALQAGTIFGAKILCLGVLHRNESAQRLYQSMGFTLMHNFIHCERR